MARGHEPTVPLSAARIAFANDLLSWARGGCEGTCPTYDMPAYSSHDRCDHCNRHPVHCTCWAEHESWDDRDTFDATPEEVAR